jgi:hypothetical protein
MTHSIHQFYGGKSNPTIWATYMCVLLLMSKVKNRYNGEKIALSGHPVNATQTTGNCHTKLEIKGSIFRNVINT